MDNHTMMVEDIVRTKHPNAGVGMGRLGVDHDAGRTNRYSVNAVQDRCRMMRSDRTREDRYRGTEDRHGIIRHEELVCAGKAASPLTGLDTAINLALGQPTLDGLRSGDHATLRACELIDLSGDIHA